MQIELLNKLNELQTVVVRLSSMPVGQKHIVVPFIDWCTLFDLVNEVVELANMKPIEFHKADPVIPLLTRIKNIMDITGCEFDQAMTAISYLDGQKRNPS